MRNNPLSTLVKFAAAFLLTALLSQGLGANGIFAGHIPDLTPVAVFIFAARRPHEFSTTLAFVLGIGADLLYGRMVGVGAGALVLAAEGARAWGIASERPSALKDFAAFIVIAIGHACLLWTFSAIGLAASPPLVDGFRQAFGCVVAYPVWHLVLRYSFRMRRARRGRV